MLIRFLKKRDGGNVLSCVRADGTSTWQHQRDDFFAPHDLTHFAIETTLGLQDAFYGLLASGWDIADFGPPWPRGPLPPDALWAEHLAGAFDVERAGGVQTDADELNAWLATAYQNIGVVLHRAVTEEELVQIRDTAQNLIARWRHTPRGEALELTFETAGFELTPSRATAR